VKKTRKITILICLTAMLLTGCATTNNNTRDANRTKTEGALLGALLGGLIGAKTGGNKSRNLGILLGAAAGYAIGNKVAENKQRYAKIEDFYFDEISKAENYNDQLRNTNQNISKNIYNINNQIAMTRTSSMSQSSKKQELKSIKNQLKAEVKMNRNALVTHKGELGYKQEVLADITKTYGSNNTTHQDLSKQINVLKNNIAHMENLNRQLASTDTSML
jgi:chromosome segregation ATPase